MVGELNTGSKVRWSIYRREDGGGDVSVEGGTDGAAGESFFTGPKLAARYAEIVAKSPSDASRPLDTMSSMTVFH
jgi:hypothetical protein